MVMERFRLHIYLLNSDKNMSDLDVARSVIIHACAGLYIYYQFTDIWKYKVWFYSCPWNFLSMFHWKRRDISATSAA